MRKPDPASSGLNPMANNTGLAARPRLPEQAEPLLTAKPRRAMARTSARPDRGRPERSATSRLMWWGSRRSWELGSGPVSRTPGSCMRALSSSSRRACRDCWPVPGRSEATASATAADQRAQLVAPSDHEGSDAPGSLELVGAATEQIHGQIAELKQAMAHHLHRIHVQRHAVAPAKLPRRLNRLQGAHLALPPDQRDQARGWNQKLCQGVQAQQAAAINRNLGDLPAAPLQRLGRRLGGWVLHRRHEQASRLCHGGAAP